MDELATYEPPALVELGEFNEDTLGPFWGSHRDKVNDFV